MIAQTTKGKTMLFNITYDFTQNFVSYTNNLVGRDRNSGAPVGYGPNGPGGLFSIDELPIVLRTLTTQLAAYPTLHLHPYNRD